MLKFQRQILEKYVGGLANISKKLIDLNACDFGDLILHCVKIFEENRYK